MPHRTTAGSRLRRARCAAFGLCLGLAVLAGAAAADDPVRVSDSAGLGRALAAATGGVILLDSGSYGDLVVRHAPPARVTLRAVAPYGAVFTRILIEGGGNLLFDGITTDRFSAVRGASQVGLVNAQVRALLYVRDAHGLRVEGNDIRGDLHAALFNSVQDFVLRDNLIHDATEDLLRITGDSHDGLVEGNRLLDMHAEDHRATGGGTNHSDAIQMFGVNGKTPHDIIIRRNHIWDDPATGAPTTTPQGIFLADPAPDGYRDILIEQNLIAVRSPNSIYIDGGQKNVVVRNNTLILGAGGGGAIIRLTTKTDFDNSGTTVTGNVMKLLLDKTRHSKVGPNFIYGRNATLSRLFSGPGSRWQDFVPVPPSRFALGMGLGADDYLSDLLAGR